jgi:hypothetical protein
VQNKFNPAIYAAIMKSAQLLFQKTVTINSCAENAKEKPTSQNLSVFLTE